MNKEEFKCFKIALSIKGKGLLDHLTEEELYQEYLKWKKSH